MNTPSDSPSPVSAIETLVEAIKGRLMSVRECGKRAMCPCSSCDGMLRRMQEDADALQHLLTLERSRQQEPEAAGARADAAEASLATLQQERDQNNDEDTRVVEGQPRRADRQDLPRPVESESER